MKFLGKVPVGSDEESATELRVYEPSEVWLDWWNECLSASGEDETAYYHCLQSRREEALAGCGLWEEPEYSMVLSQSGFSWAFLDGRPVPACDAAKVIIV